jgi:hypothetical protein
MGDFHFKNNPLPHQVMICIKENIVAPDSVVIQADGILDQESIPILRNILRRHLERKKTVSLNLLGLLHISREGRIFLPEFKGKIDFIDPGLFLDDYLSH